MRNPYKRRGKNSEEISSQKILIDGNTSIALGALFAGCQFLSWYPITPASSLAENFERLAGLYQIDKEGKKKFMVLQSEDELSAITQSPGRGLGGPASHDDKLRSRAFTDERGGGAGLFRRNPRCVMQCSKSWPFHRASHTNPARGIFSPPAFCLMATANISPFFLEPLKKLFLSQQKLLTWLKSYKLLLSF